MLLVAVLVTRLVTSWGDKVVVLVTTIVALGDIEVAFRIVFVDMNPPVPSIVDEMAITTLVTVRAKVVSIVVFNPVVVVVTGSMVSCEAVVYPWETPDAISSIMAFPSCSLILCTFAGSAENHSGTSGSYVPSHLGGAVTYAGMS